MVMQYSESANSKVTFHNICGEVAIGEHMLLHLSKKSKLKMYLDLLNN